MVASQSGCCYLKANHIDVVLCSYVPGILGSHAACQLQSFLPSGFSFYRALLLVLSIVTGLHEDLLGKLILRLSTRWRVCWFFHNLALPLYSRCIISSPLSLSDSTCFLVFLTISLRRFEMTKARYYIHSELSSAAVNSANPRVSSPQALNHQTW